MVESSWTKGRAWWAILRRASFARFTNSEELVMMWWRSVVKSELASDEGRCWNELTRYRWKSSVPAERGMGLRCEARSLLEWVESSASVSEMVVSGIVARREWARLIQTCSCLR